MLVSVAIWNVASEACRWNFLCSQLHVVLVPSFHIYVLWKLKGENILKIHLCCCNAILQIEICYCFENVMLYLCQPRCVIRNRVEVLFKKHVYVAVSRNGDFPIFIPILIVKCFHFYISIIICFHCLNLNFKWTFFRHLHEVLFSITNLIVISVSAFCHIIHYILL